MHIPFCAARCSYCDFCSTVVPPDARDAALDAYCAALMQQIAAWGHLVPAGTTVSSVYIGGGTPSLLGRRLPVLLAALRQSFDLQQLREITVEANPESFDDQLAAVLAAAGVTRISLGVQSLDNQALQLLGRIHTADSAVAALQAAKNAGLRVSADFLFGLPTDSSVPTDAHTAARQLAADLQAVAAEIEHLSVYPLTAEAGTLLYQQLDEQIVQLPDQEALVDQLAAVEQLLTQQGFIRYEISSYAHPGAQCQHNLRYWTCDSRRGDYLGFGVSAASMLNHADGSRSRFVLHNTREDYLQQPDTTTPAQSEALTPAQARREDVMLALRTKTGAPLSAVTEAGLQYVCKELCQEELLTREDDHYRCTNRGWLLGNTVFSRVWNAPNSAT